MRLDPQTLREVARDLDRAEQKARQRVRSADCQGCEYLWTGRALSYEEAATELRTAAIIAESSDQPTRFFRAGEVIGSWLAYAVMGMIALIGLAFALAVLAGAWWLLATVAGWSA